MANETVELYYKGKPINPNRDLPTRTYAEAQAEGLTSSDKLWVRNDAPQSDLIVDNLTTDDSARALSAKQGKVLNDKFEWKEVGRVLSNSTSATSANLSENIANKNEIMILFGYTSYDTASRFSYVVPMSLFKTHGFWADMTNADYYTPSNAPTRNIVQINYTDATHISVSQAPATGSSALGVYIKFYAR